MYGRMIAAGALACSATFGLALAQRTSMTGSQGNWTVHTASKSGCPGLSLQVQRDGNNLKEVRDHRRYDWHEPTDWYDRRQAGVHAHHDTG